MPPPAAESCSSSSGDEELRAKAGGPWGVSQFIEVRLELRGEEAAEAGSATRAPPKVLSGVVGAEKKGIGCAAALRRSIVSASAINDWAEGLPHDISLQREKRRGEGKEIKL